MSVSSRTRPVGTAILLAMVSLASAEIGPTLAGHPAQELLTLALREFEACKDDGCKDFGSDLWQLRKRLANKESLAQMALQVEQGDDACLCGNKSPTVLAVDRQAQMLAEATILYHLAGDPAGSAYNASRLRNIAAKEPGNLVIDELLVRTLAITAGPDVALREIASIPYVVPRLHILISAADTKALPPESKRRLLGDALSHWRNAGDADKATMAAPLARALARAGMAAEAESVVAAFTDDAAREKARSAARVLPPAQPRAENPASPAARAAAMIEGNSNPRDVVTSLASVSENRSYTLSRAGELASAKAAPARITAVANALPKGADRLSFLLGAIRGMTKNSDRVVYEDVLLTHPYAP